MNNKQEAIEKGYVHFGYFSPETSSNDEYPRYIKDAVAEAVEKIKTYQTGQCINFAFMTDVHYSKTVIHDLRTKRLINAYKDIKEAIGADMLILGGDHTNNGNKAYGIECFEGLKEHLCGLKYFPVNGNHDDNSIWDYYIESEKSVNHHTVQEIYNMFYSHLPEIGANIEGEDTLYYYFDDPSASVRYIFLDTNDIPMIYTETGTLEYTKQSCFGVSQAQADWLINTALDTKENTDIIICAHNAFFPSFDKKDLNEVLEDVNYIESKPIRFLNEIFDAYNQKASLCQEYGEGIFKVCVNADFSKCNGNILCFMAGHHHRDIVEKSQGGIPIIYSDCAIMYKYNTPRVDGDISELLFDVVTIDTTNKKIYITRIGAGEDRVIDL